MVVTLWGKKLPTNPFPTLSAFEHSLETLGGVSSALRDHLRQKYLTGGLVWQDIPPEVERWFYDQYDSCVAAEWILLCRVGIVRHFWHRDSKTVSVKVSRSNVLLCRRLNAQDRVLRGFEDVGT